MSEPEDLHIYRLPNGEEIAAIADDRDRLLLYEESEWSEGGRPSYYWDDRYKELRGRAEGDGGNPKTWPLLFLRAPDLLDTGREIVECDSCGEPVWEPHVCPDVSDDIAWDRMSLQHTEDCQWIISRGFRL